GAVRGDHATVTIAQYAPRGREIEGLDDVFASDACIVIVRDDLQVHDAREQREERDGYAERHPLVALLELSDLAADAQQVHGTAWGSSRRRKPSMRRTSRKMKGASAPVARLGANRATAR